MIPLEGIEPNDKPKPGSRTSRNHGPWGRTVEVKSNSYREGSLEFSKRSRVYLGTRRPNATQVSTSFHQDYFRDQHKLNFGTNFLLEGKNVTTRNSRSFFKHQNFIIHLGKITTHQLLFIIYYSPITIHHFTIHHFWSQFEIPRSIQKIYYSSDTINFWRENTIHVHHSFYRKFSLRVFKVA